MTSTPDWVANLRVTPEAAIWIRRQRTPVTAHELHGDERANAQQRASVIWPRVAQYQRMSGRVVPFFLLKPRG